MKPCPCCNVVGTVTVQGIPYEIILCNKEWLHVRFLNDNSFVSSCSIKKAKKIFLDKDTNWLDTVFHDGLKLAEKQLS